MTDHTDENAGKAATLAQQIVSALIDESSETRRRAITAAMVLLGEAPISRSESNVDENNNEAGEDLGSFFDREEKLKPSDNAQLCAAYHYSEYGMAPFSLDEIRSIANDAGLILPERLDMTLTAATKKGKKLFQGAGRGLVRPTTAAGLAFRERWGVKPGKKVKEG